MRNGTFFSERAIPQYGVIEGEAPENSWHQAWRWMFFSETVCVLAFVFFVFSLPRSPHWLAEKGRYDEARSVLTRIGGADFATREIAEIQESLEALADDV